jgi:hypothetical protein
MPDIQSAHYVRVRYCGPGDRRGSRFAVTWEGWPTEGKPQRRFIPYTSDRDAMCTTVARMFCDWLSEMPGDDEPLHTFEPKRVTYGSLDGDTWALLIETERKPREA